jgi:hypothetical protein
MNELNQGPRVLDILQRSPIGVVAQIGAGIARHACGKPGPAQRGEQTRERRIAKQRSGSIHFDSCACGTTTAHVGKKNRSGVARARLDAKLAPARREPKDQDHVGLWRQ